MKTLQLSETTAKRLYPASNAEFKALLEESFGKDFFSIKNELPTSFEEACEMNSSDPEDDKFKIGSPAGIAFEKLLEVAAALRKGVILSYKDSNQPKWYPVHEYAASGFRFVGSRYVYAFTYSPVGLCVQDEKTASYFGKQFIDLFEQYKN